MVKSTAFVWPLLIGAVIGAIILFFSMKACNAPKPETVYKTDTVYKPGEKPLTPSPSEPVKPKVVIIYRDTGSVKLVELPPDTIRVPNTSRSGTVFIQGTFQGNEISVATRDSLGQIMEKKWPVDFNKYGYLLRNLDFGLEKYNIPSADKPSNSPIQVSTKNKIWTQGTIQTSWSIPHKGARLYTDYSLMYKNFGVFVYGELRSYQKYGDAGAGIKVTF